ncbi:MAG: hypothetical protein ACYC5A_09455 [Thermoleophilia bacterium]
MFFEDREIIYQEASPNGRWRLTIYAPLEVDEATAPNTGEPYDPGPTYFAEFEKGNGIVAVGFPFGTSDREQELKVDWSLPGKVCAVSLDGENYLLLKWGVCFIKPRELNKVEQEGPVTQEEMDAFLEKALKENKD